MFPPLAKNRRFYTPLIKSSPLHGESSASQEESPPLQRDFSSYKSGKAFCLQGRNVKQLKKPLRRAESASTSRVPEAAKKWRRFAAPSVSLEGVLLSKLCGAGHCRIHGVGVCFLASRSEVKCH